MTLDRAHTLEAEIQRLIAALQTRRAATAPPDAAFIDEVLVLLGGALARVRALIGGTSPLPEPNVYL